MLKDGKYVLAYLMPLAGFAGIYFKGYCSFGAVYLAFVALPLIELFTSASEQNHPEEQESRREHHRFFDWLLYLNLPILYALIAYFLWTLNHYSLSPMEVTGMSLNVGLIIGTIGINVAHELGHRAQKYEQWMAKILLISGLYTHFFIEHNRGHHRHVATPLDPASARYGEAIYAFWIRSVTGGWMNAWRLEKKRLEKRGIPHWHWKNSFLQWQAAQLLYLALLYALFGFTGLWAGIAAAVVGFLLLESVNYIEHYGLRRKKLANGRYERVLPRHSWNSNHEMGRIFLYELTRHSDHHYKASRKYQILRHWDESPQLPQGYPASILLALLPPIWFAIMNPRVE